MGQQASVGGKPAKARPTVFVDKFTNMFIRVPIVIGCGHIMGTMKGWDTCVNRLITKCMFIDVGKHVNSVFLSSQV
jgi:hypothetical protein